MQFAFLAFLKELGWADSFWVEEKGKLHLYPRTKEQLMEALKTGKKKELPFSLCPFEESQNLLFHVCRIAPFFCFEGGFWSCNFSFPASVVPHQEMLFPTLLFSRSLLLSFFVFPFTAMGTFYFLEVTGVDREGVEQTWPGHLFHSFQNELAFFPLESKIFFKKSPAQAAALFSSFDHAWECASFLFEEKLIESFVLYPPSLLFPFGFSSFDEWLALFSLAWKGDGAPPLDILKTLALSYNGYLDGVKMNLFFQQASPSCLYFLCSKERLVSLDSQIKSMVRSLTTEPPVQGLVLVDPFTFLLWYRFRFDRKIVGDEAQVMKTIMNSGAYLGAQPLCPQIPAQCKHLSLII